MTVLVTGASGIFGMAAIRPLIAAGERVRALSSNAVSAERLRREGLEVIVGDLREDAAVAAAVGGVRRIVHIPPVFMAEEAQIGRRVVGAARAAGLEHFVFVSVFHPQMSRMRHHHNKLLIEEMVIESGLPFTILQPAMLMQNLRFEWPQVIETGELARPYDAGRMMAVVDVRDVGEATALAVRDPRMSGGVFELCGDRLTTHRMAEILAHVTGRRIATRLEGEAEWVASARLRGFDDAQIETRRMMIRHYQEHGFPGGSSLVLAAILGREPRDYGDFARDFVAGQASC